MKKKNHTIFLCINYIEKDIYVPEYDDRDSPSINLKKIITQNYKRNFLSFMHLHL